MREDKGGWTAGAADAEVAPARHAAADLSGETGRAAAVAQARHAAGGRARRQPSPKARHAAEPDTLAADLRPLAIALAALALVIALVGGLLVAYAQAAAARTEAGQAASADGQPAASTVARTAAGFSESTVGAGQTVDLTDAAVAAPDTGPAAEASVPTYTLADLASDQAAAAQAAQSIANVQAALDALAQTYGDTLSAAYIPLSDPDVLVGIAADESLLSASMIKLLVLACLLDQVGTGAVDLSDELVVTPEELADGTGNIQFQGAGVAFTVYELAYYMIADSDNTAANVLIDLLGIDLVNAEAQALGLTGTNLANKLNSSGPKNDGYNVTTAADAARLLAAFATGQVGSYDLSGVAVDFLASQNIEGGISQGVPDGVVVAHKTGSIDGFEHDGAIVYGDAPYVLVVLTQDAPDGQAVAAEVSAAVWDATNGSR